ncbi:hypothetical protein CHS0354_014105 [Potamilus streckersoni]|uniref:Uncharacterized protein n=1 Tax=Potamilus streckersoni TaxID=2493646 RepID=A0AAE0WDY3_9BIVA|nr:hypothetical protein CHS0354_014105 [Potamilus streckersoni]
MKIIHYRPILVFIFIIALVILYIQVKYTNEKRMVIECGKIFKERKEVLTRQQLDNIVTTRSTVMSGRNSTLNLDISLFNDVNSGFKNQPIVTLFTSFKTDYAMDSEKVLVYNNTLYNWQTLRPHAQLIFFTKDASAGEKVKFIHWNIFPVLHYSESGIPAIKDMYKQARELYNTSWYGYFNGDILLTEDILETLKYVSSVSDNFPNASILIIGRRMNVLNVTSEEVTKMNGIKESARSRGSLYEIDAEDYFITNRLFPWNKIPEFVIGRAGYDNWIVGHARCDLGTIVIDATETLTAVHQTTSKGGNKEGFAHEDKNYNLELIKRLKLPKRFLQGLTTCAEWRTVRTIKTGRIELVKRDDQHKNCKCKK